MTDTWERVVSKRVAAGPSSRKPGFDPTPFHVRFVRVFPFPLSVSCHQSYIISNFHQHIALTDRTNELSKKQCCFMKPWINGRTELSLIVGFPHQTTFPTLRQLTSKSKVHGYIDYFSSPSSGAENLINSEVSQCAVCGAHSGPAHQQHHTGAVLCCAVLHTHSFIYHRHLRVLAAESVVKQRVQRK